MEKLTGFVAEHLNDNLTRLILDRARWPEIDMDLALSCIESRRKLKGKVQEWYDEKELIFPSKLSAEQCSSSATAAYKAELAGRIAGNGSCPASSWNIADLTGGLGVDSWFFSRKASAVLYNEMQEALCKAASHNFSILGADNICVINKAVSSKGSLEGTSPEELLSGFHADIIYMDPARRGEGGRKVFLIEECTPDVLTLKKELFEICRHLLIKLSPMADISMVCERLGRTCREVHVVAAGGECKELLIWMDREWNDGYEIIAAELQKDGTVSEFRFDPREETLSKECITTASTNGSFLFEPGKALMKAGAFNTIAKRFRIDKLGQSTHYYMTDELEKAESLMKHGKIFRIIKALPLDKRTIKEIGKTYPKAEVTARNIPMDTDTLRKKLGAASGDDIHIFGLRSDLSGNILLVTSKYNGV